ncbi:uncharacterized protein LOC129306669 isoform X1 [Prosopis cineraria]|uniref:uncharacterized protein LOC129306669 isoform X1 n=1 Tax=Prosopis cineraria TaxID=364024 RepID=UPI00240F251E|nr:uncharacterized protein LOC129306669 isoform X1 [Prosopis cineraria]
MDLHDWEFLSDDPCFDLNHNLPKRIIPQDKPNSDSKNSLDSDYILCPSPSVRKITPPDQVVPVPIPLEPKIENAIDVQTVKGISKNPDEVKAEQQAASLAQVSFETKENEFVDNTMNPINSDELKFGREMGDSDKEEDKNGGFNLWKWSLTGIGAICTFGVTAASICVLFLGTQQKNRHHQNQQNVFNFYTDDKRIKRAMEHATDWNEAISASVRSGPIARAHITYGTYPDGLLSMD